MPAGAGVVSEMVRSSTEPDMGAISCQLSGAADGGPGQLMRART